jgi:hypothetical protein
MIIRTNLYRELLEVNRPAPWKARAALWASFVLLAAFGYWFYLQHHVSLLQKQFTGAEGELSRAREQLAAIRARSEEVRKKVERREAILTFATMRINFAPALEQIFASVPVTVELAELRLTREGPQSLRLRVNGSGAGERPRLECDKFRIQLEDSLAGEYASVTVNFERLEDAERTLQLEGEARAVADFAINAGWQTAAHGR